MSVYMWITCSNVLVENITAVAPPESPYTCGIVPGLSKNFFHSGELVMSTACFNVFVVDFP